MGFIKMTDAELQAIGLASQDDANLNKETGDFSNNSWSYENTFISDDISEIRKKYINGINSIFLIWFKTVATGGNEYSKYEFYKEV